MSLEDSSDETVARPVMGNLALDHERMEQVRSDWFHAMDGGWFQDWVDSHFSDDLHFVVAGMMNDPTEDRAAYGKMSLLLHYNNMIHDVYKDPNAVVEWTNLGVRYLSPETYTVDWEIVVERPGEPLLVSNRRFTMSVRDGKIYALIMSARCPSDDMSADLLDTRGCVPESDPPVPVPPCRHNSWDSMRAKHTFTMLRCRVCGVAWKLPARQSHLFRCTELITDSCPHEPTACRRIHIHHKKRRLHEIRQYAASGKAAGKFQEQEASENSEEVIPALPG
ncbi:hypothetical protein DIPPA_27216 [Diplonema papillatum]|nr:hypothetical protein DIPPA_27216 [Diplonema papillatum]